MQLRRVERDDFVAGDVIAQRVEQFAGHDLSTAEQLRMVHRIELEEIAAALRILDEKPCRLALHLGFCQGERGGRGVLRMTGAPPHLLRCELRRIPIREERGVAHFAGAEVD